MVTEVKLDLGEEYGVILIEAIGEIPQERQGGLVQAGLEDKLRDAKDIVINAPSTFLQRKLTGLANTLVASLPTVEVAEHYQLDSFTVEFQIGLGLEAGADSPVVVKISPSGCFKCTYTWKRKLPTPTEQATTTNVPMSNL